MVRTMTRAEYEKTYGVKPVISPTSTLDTSFAPRKMTRLEYDAEFGNYQAPETKNIFTPVKEAIKGLGTTYQEAPSKFLEDIKAGAEDYQKGNYIKGTVKSGGRLAGDVAGVIFAPIGAAIQATGANYVFDWIGEQSQKLPGIKAITDLPAVQDFATTHPNAGEDFGRVLNLALSAAETGKIDPKTVIPRTIEQVKTAKANLATKYTDYQNEKVMAQNEKAITGIESEISNIQNNYSKLKKINQFSSDEGKASRRRIAETDVLVDSVGVDGKIDTTGKGRAIDQYKELFLNGKESIVKDNLVREGKSINLKQVENALYEEVNSSGLEGSDLVSAINGVKNEIAGLKLRADELGNIKLDKIHDAKISTNDSINYRIDDNPTIKYRKAKARTYKKLVEDNSNTNVKQINAELKKYYDDIDTLKDLDGRNVKGSKLGKYFAQISGNLVGGAVGGAIGGLPGMAIGTVLGGETAGYIKGKQMAGTFGEGSGAEIKANPILEKAKTESKLPPKINLKVSDPVVGTPKGITKTKDILKIENDIRKNVEAQRTAIKAGDFTLVATLKTIYQALTTNLIEKIKQTKNIQSNSLGKRNVQYKIAKTTSKNAIPKSNIKTPTESSAEVIKMTTDLRDNYAKIGEKAEEELFKIYTEMELSEPGYRLIQDYGVDRTVIGVRSTFPKWLPEEYRSRELFDNVMPNLTEIAKLEYPSGNRPAQRKFYNILLEQLDVELGVDTSSIRNKILNYYDKTKQKETSNSVDASIERGESFTDDEIARFYEEYEKNN